MSASDCALIFPGQGSHHEGMDVPHRGGELFERALAALDYDPFGSLEKGTRYQQPAILLCSLGAWDTLNQREPLDVPLAAAGHSLGEYAALAAAGALELEDAVALVDARAEAMAAASAARPGGMLALLGGDEDAIVSLARRLGLVVANDNAPGQLVLAGPLYAIAAAETQAREDTGARTRRLDVGGAFHSPLMAPAAERLGQALERTSVREPRFPVFSCSSAAPFQDVRRELAENLLRPVRWRQTLLALHEAGAREFREVGPGTILTGLVKRTLVAA